MVPPEMIYMGPWMQHFVYQCVSAAADSLALLLHLTTSRPQIITYFDEMLPHAAVVAIDKIAKHLVDYRGFGDFSDEMRGMSEGLELDLGYVVAANLVYQLEAIGVNCSNWNNTGPTGQCEDEVPTGEVSWEYSNHYLKTQLDEVATGYCTSVVSNTAEGNIIHGRNLDWNLDETLR